MKYDLTCMTPIIIGRAKSKMTSHQHVEDLIDKSVKHLQPITGRM